MTTETKIVVYHDDSPIETADRIARALGAGPARIEKGDPRTGWAEYTITVPATVAAQTPAERAIGDFCRMAAGGAPATLHGFADGSMMMTLTLSEAVSAHAALAHMAAHGGPFGMTKIDMDECRAVGQRLFAVIEETDRQPLPPATESEGK